MCQFVIKIYQKKRNCVLTSDVRPRNRDLLVAICVSFAVIINHIVCLTLKIRVILGQSIESESILVHNEFHFPGVFGLPSLEVNNTSAMAKVFVCIGTGLFCLFFISLVTYSKIDSESCLVLFPIYALGPWVRRSWHPCRVICLVRLFDVIGVPQPGHFTLGLRPVYLLVVISSFCWHDFCRFCSGW